MKNEKNAYLVDDDTGFEVVIYAGSAQEALEKAEPVSADFVEYAHEVEIIRLAVILDENGPACGGETARSTTRLRPMWRSYLIEDEDRGEGMEPPEMFEARVRGTLVARSPQEALERAAKVFPDRCGPRVVTPRIGASETEYIGCARATRI